MAVDVDKFGYKQVGILLEWWKFLTGFQFVLSLLRQNYSGGVIAFTRNQYQKVNGHPNSFWAWGGEDNDLTNRIENAGFVLDRYPHGIANHLTAYVSLPHKASFPNPNWYAHLEPNRKFVLLLLNNRIDLYVFALQAKTGKISYESISNGWTKLN